MRPPPAALLAAAVPAAVLACDPGGFFPFGPAKWLAVSMLVPAAAALLFLARPARFAPRPTLAMAALVGAVALAAAVGEEPLYAWIGTPERRLGLLTWVLIGVAFVAGQSTTPADRRPVLGGFVVAGIGTGTAAVLEAFGWLPHTLDAGSRLGGTFGSPAYLGAAVTLLLPVAAGVAADGSWPRPWRVAAGAAGATLVVAALGSGARAAWVGLAVAALVTASTHRRRLTAHRRIVAVGALCAVVGLGGIAAATPVGDRISDTFDADAAGGQGRLDEWRVAVAVLAEHPLTGVGPEGYRVAFPDGVDVAYEREHGREPTPDRAHSAPLDIALAGGPLALLAWAALLVLLGPFLRRALRSERPWLVGAATGLLAYAAGELLLFPLAELEPVAAVLAGVVVATAQPGELRSRVVPRYVPAVLGVVGIVAGGAGILELAADRQADQSAEAASTGVDPAGAVDHAQHAVDRRPDILRNHLLLAAALEADQQGAAAALAAVDDALDLSPRDPIALRRRAELLVIRADSTLVPAHIRAARDELARMLDADPINAELWVLSGVVARLDGDVDAARAAFQEAIRITPGDARPVLALSQLEIEQLYLRLRDGTG